jgi:D-alanine-D-alanine ligase
MRVVVFYNQSSEDSALEDRDVLLQRDAVLQSLARLGYETGHIACSLNLAAARTQLEAQRPDVVFNLVESLGGTDRLMVLGTLLLDAMNLAYTGSPTSAVLATTGKLDAKRRMLDAGLPTPAWFSFPGLDGQPPGCGGDAAPSCRVAAERVIVKPVWEHASWGMDEDAILEMPGRDALERHIQRRSADTGRPHFAELFVEGREFNLSLLEMPWFSGSAAAEFSEDPDMRVVSEGPSGSDVMVLPPAEIDFSQLSPDKPRIVGYRAKWDEQSEEYQRTPRRFEFPAHDDGLLAQLRELALSCWRLFGLSGYARVDFRVDDAGCPWILEVNTNPCLSPDAGFAAALDHQGMEYDKAMAQIVASAVFRQTLRAPRVGNHHV